MSCNLTKKQFEVLKALASETDVSKTQRKLMEETGLSLGTINKIVNEVMGFGFVADGKITKQGLEALEPYRVKRAIFLAAGFGSRLVPVTLNTPKPLVRVFGERIIDRLIDACIGIGIEEIYIVRGYLAEQFNQLLDKYPFINFIENLQFNEANNISSAIKARDFLQNSYVFESDLLLNNPSILQKYHYHSDVLGIWKDRTDDWCFSQQNGFVSEEKVGGVNCWQMVGIYYFNEEDGKKLKNHLEYAYNQPGGKERYWETVPNQVYRGQYKIEILPCTEDDIVEIDTFNELVAIDKTYRV